MSLRPSVSELLVRNQEYAKTHRPFPLVNEMPPNRLKPRTLIYCCLDPRIQPEIFLDLKPGEVNLIRNAGCTIPRNLNDLLVLDQLNTYDEIFIIVHTDCGGTHTTQGGIRRGIKKYVEGYDEEIEALVFETFTDPKDRARDNVEFVKNHPLIRKELAAKTTGAVYGIKTGKLTTVEA